MAKSVICSADWCAEASDEETLHFLIEAARPHVDQAGPYRDELSKLLENHDWAGLANYSQNYGTGDTDSHYHARQAVAFFSKLESLPLGVDRSAVAWESFLTSESKCRETNRRLRDARLDGTKTPSSVASVLFAAQRKISDILGPVPCLSKLKVSFGSGANTTIKAKASTAKWKLDAQPACSNELVPILGSVLSNIPHYAYEHRTTAASTLLERLEEHMAETFHVDVLITDGLLQFVPKNAKTDRSIVVEPMLNSLFQKGIGLYIKQKLRKIGIDIRTQSEQNKELARRASVDQSLATIDLSAASDTISLETVAELLPLDWYCFLRNFRTGNVSYQGNRITLEKFSSMGNGFTFELETLLFVSLARACCAVLRIGDSECTSYGDDIVIPTGAVSLLKETLEYLGFELNVEKSFSFGPFRESCGGDFLDGFDIRPFFQKKNVSGQTLFSLHNFYMRTFQFERALEVESRIHPDLIQKGPDGYGDGHLIGDWSQAARSFKRDLGWEGVLFCTFAKKQKTLKRKLKRGDRLFPSYSIYVSYETEPSDHNTVRGDEGYKRISIYTLSTGVFSR